MRLWQLLIVSAVVALIGWLYWSSTPAPPPRAPRSEVTWGPNKNRLNCDTMETDHPLPDVDPITRARILDLLKKACQEPLPR